MEPTDSRWLSTGKAVKQLIRPSQFSATYKVLSTASDAIGQRIFSQLKNPRFIASLLSFVDVLNVVYALSLRLQATNLESSLVTFYVKTAVACIDEQVATPGLHYNSLSEELTAGGDLSFLVIYWNVQLAVVENMRKQFVGAVRDKIK